MNEPELRRAYRRCRQINRTHGTSYYWSTLLLPRDKQQDVFALYAFCRLADDIVDDLGASAPADRAAALHQFADRFFEDLRRGRSDDDVLLATVHTVRRWDIDPACFERFVRSMAMDLTIDHYDTWSDLCDYMDGSAAVIGEMVLPILEPADVAAFEPARRLGLAFQLTNFLRDVDEDLDRGRVYLPQEDLERFGVDPWARTVTPAWVELMRFEIERARELYREAEAGIRFLPDRSARCIAVARVLYAEILDRIESAGYDVFASRVRVPTSRKVRLAARGLIGRTSRPLVPAPEAGLLAIGSRKPNGSAP